jgi:hypothetical protein
VTTYVDLDSLPASTLRHLAALRERRDRERDFSRYLDYEAMAEELAVMLSAGRKPTVGWYRRRLRPPELSEWHGPDVYRGEEPGGLEAR